MAGFASAVARVWDRFFFRGCSAEQLGLLRILIGLGMLPFHHLQFHRLLELDLDGAHFYFLDPIWYFGVLGIEALDPTGIVAAFVLLMLSTLAFALGLLTRSSLVTMLLCVVYLKGMRDSVAGDVHHRYLIPFHVLLMFLFSGCGRVYSVDNLWRKGRTRVAEWQATWPIRAAQLYVCMFYLWSGIAKARMSGLDWAQGERIQQLLLGRSVRFGFENGVPAGSSLAFELAHSQLVCSVLAASTYVFEFGFPLILLIRDTRLRLLFFAGVTLFHLSNFVLLSVKFLFLPVVFLLFFDVSAAFVRRRSWVSQPQAWKAVPESDAAR